ncbi:uncharacterized protein LOC133369125 [Rhineura floridana]|uniref:uncharacterized protein LOC133369125 n=1 Tax=Rhineura floridana TaxID=261503 RepID=UPI002AC865FC|nr:uncharacterized protein LOC133369125 [Rhineura floridana]
MTSALGSLSGHSSSHGPSIARVYLSDQRQGTAPDAPLNSRCDVSGKSPGHTRINHPYHPLGSAPHSSTPVGLTAVSVGHCQLHTPGDSYFLLTAVFLPMVVVNSESSEGGPFPRAAQDCSYSRHQSDRLGAHCDSLFTQGTWSLAKKGNSINWLELRAVHLALCHFQTMFPLTHVLIYTDNTCIKSHLNCKGHQVSNSSGEDHFDIHLGRETPAVLEGRTSQRGFKCHCRLAKLTASDSGGMELTSSSASSPPASLQSFDCGSVCLEQQLAASPVLLKTLDGAITHMMACYLGKPPFW